MRGRSLLLLVLLVLPSAASVAEPAVTDRVLVTLDTWPPEPGHERVLEAAGADILASYDAASTLLVEAPPGAVERLAELPFVAAVTPDEPLETNLASSRPAIGLTQEMVDAGLTGQGATIALVDSGIDATHPGLDDRVKANLAVGPDGVEEQNTPGSKHGTHVAGVLVGTGEGAEQTPHVGLAPGAELVSLDLSQEFTTSNALRAFEWIYENHEEEGIEVVSNSWGRQRDPATYEPDDPLIRASNALVSEGLVVVFSAGNGGEGEGQMTLEGTNPNVITVGASTDEGQVEPYSSRGPVYTDDGERANWTKPDLVAPGSRIVSTRAGGSAGNHYVMMNGTSMAAPHVAGAAALLVSMRPGLSPSQVKGMLLSSADDVGPPGIDDASGAGFMDLAGALSILRQADTNVQEHETTKRHDGQLTGPGEAGSVLQAASIDHDDRFPVETPPNATRLALDIQWDGRSDLKVRLSSPSDETRTYRVQGQRTITVQDPEPGTWHVRVQPDGPERGRYEAEATVTWLERLDGRSIPIAAQDDHTATFPQVTNPGPLGLPGSIVPGVPNVIPLAAGGVLTVLMVAGRMRGNERHEPEEETADSVAWGR